MVMASSTASSRLKLSTVMIGPPFEVGTANLRPAQRGCQSAGWSRIERMERTPSGHCFRGAVVTVSDKGSAGLREDLSGPLLAGLVARLGGELVSRSVVPDDVEAVRKAFREAAAAVGKGLVLS